MIWIIVTSVQSSSPPLHIGFMLYQFPIKLDNYIIYSSPEFSIYKEKKKWHDSVVFLFSLQLVKMKYLFFQVTSFTFHSLYVHKISHLIFSKGDCNKRFRTKPLIHITKTQYTKPKTIQISAIRVYLGVEQERLYKSGWTDKGGKEGSITSWNGV